jgi:non-specific serine/threonine protein kinase
VQKPALRISPPPKSLNAAKASADGAVTLTRSEGGRIEGTVQDGGEALPVAIRLNDERYFDTSCTCAETASPLCAHKTAMFVHTLRSVGAAAFAPSRAPDEQKARLLAAYGYTPDDDLTGKFAFSTEGGKIFLRVLDSSIKKKSVAAPIEEGAGAAVAVAEEDARSLGPRD